MKYFSLITLLLFIPRSVFAHAKWFVDAPAVIANLHGVVPFYNLSSVEVLIWAALTLIVVLAFSIVDTFVPEPKKLLTFAYTHERLINRAVSVILGIFLISVGTFWKVVLAPDLHIVGPFMMALALLQTLLGIMLVFNLYPRITAGGMMLLYVIVAVIGGLDTALEGILLPAFAAYIYLNTLHEKEDTFSLKRHATEIVRVAAAIELIALAFTEKLFYPELTIRFIEVYKWNFMQPLFPWYSDALLTLSTGFAQAIFGILFFMGYLTRTTTLFIAGFFVTSFIVMYAQTGMVEVEDLPVYAAAVVFLFFGHGKTKFFHFIFPDSLLHKPLVRKNQK